MFTGLIAAACGRLETVLLDNGHVKRSVSNGMSNGHTMVRMCKNGGTMKLANGSINGVYRNGNGVHF